MLPVKGTPSHRIARGRLRVVPLAVRGHDTLERLGESLEFFTPALLYLRGRFTDDVLTDFLCEHGGETTLYSRTFAKPVFAGLEDAEGNPAWNHTLWAVRAGQWEDLKCFLLSAKLTDTARRRMYGVGLQRLLVLDPLFLDAAAVLPQEVPLARPWAFGVNGNRSAWAFRADDKRPWLLPTAVRLPPSPEMVAFAEAAFRERNPYDSIEPTAGADAARHTGVAQRKAFRLEDAGRLDPAARRALVQSLELQARRDK